VVGLVSFPFVEPVTLLVNGGSTRNRFGDDVPTQTPVNVLGAFSPGVSAEQAAQGTASTDPEVYLPPGTQVPSWIDAVTVRGNTYQVVGQPADWRSGIDGSPMGVVVRLGAMLAEPREGA
jgi:hypothetical protein